MIDQTQAFYDSDWLAPDPPPWTPPDYSGQMSPVPPQSWFGEANNAYSRHITPFAPHITNTAPYLQGGPNDPNFGQSPPPQQGHYPFNFAGGYGGGGYSVPAAIAPQYSANMYAVTKPPTYPGPPGLGNWGLTPYQKAANASGDDPFTWDPITRTSRSWKIPWGATIGGIQVSPGTVRYNLEPGRGRTAYLQNGTQRVPLGAGSAWEQWVNQQNNPTVAAGFTPASAPANYGQPYNPKYPVAQASLPVNQWPPQFSAPPIDIQQLLQLLGSSQMPQQPNPFTAAFAAPQFTAPQPGVGGPAYGFAGGGARWGGSMTRDPGGPYGGLLA